LPRRAASPSETPAATISEIPRASTSICRCSSTFKPLQERLDIEFRAEAFNIFNHTQFRITDPSNPGNTGNNVINCYGPQSSFYSAAYAGDSQGNPSCLTGNSFLHPVDAHDPRIFQFALKGSF
jgi:hypothetical protein